MYLLLKMVVFHCYVSLPEGTRKRDIFVSSKFGGYICPLRISWIIPSKYIKEQIYAWYYWPIIKLRLADAACGTLTRITYSLEIWRWQIQGFFHNLEDHPSGCKWLITMVIVNPLLKNVLVLGSAVVLGGWLILGVWLWVPLSKVCWTRMMKELGSLMFAWWRFGNERIEEVGCPQILDLRRSKYCRSWGYLVSCLGPPKIDQAHTETHMLNRFRIMIMRLQLWTLPSNVYTPEN